ncbi:glutamine amidotransferase, partial [Candidatus Dojkabacteria bacterium]|nr:glutamine amidotransferase [Candidatus Dojkabacteria bacterium]
MNIKITHLYPEEMNLYGDLGNVIALKRRAEARDIEVSTKNVKVGASLKSGETDIYFFGGGQDKQQAKIAPDLIKLKKEELLKDLESGVVMLAICGGYQLLGK